MTTFKLQTPYQPAGSQPEAIKTLLQQRPGRSTLKGVTGSGKTFTLANVIEQHNKPTLVISPNKTLAAQLYEEFCQFFPLNKVCYFVSYYDYYQPESYLPVQDIYIPKETQVNAEIERLRIESTAALMNRKDVIVIASVSCIYSLGSPLDYQQLALPLSVGLTITRHNLLHKLLFIQYERNDIERLPGTFYVQGNTIEVQLPYYHHKLRIELFGDTIERISWVDKHKNSVCERITDTIIFPAKHFVTTQDKKDQALASIKTELNSWLPHLANDLLRDRLTRRVTHDLELLKEFGYCNGVENYSSHFDGRKPGERPFCLLDFFPKDFLCIIDESHIAIPQLRGMYAGDRSRKQNLVDFGFRLPSALDNRPLKFEEIDKQLADVIYVSATPGDYELQHSTAHVEQVVRPTGLVDPTVELRPRENQLQNLEREIKSTANSNFRTLVTVLTKRMAEELADYLENHGIKVCYLHSEIKTPERTELLQKLRTGILDCLVGVNLLREGLDLPEVALVAIMDADIECFLRDKRSLIQTIGRAARNTQSRVLLYCNSISKSMQEAINETAHRREIQLAYNKKHNITPQSVSRKVGRTISTRITPIKKEAPDKKASKRLSIKNTLKQIVSLEAAMHAAAEKLDFETAIKLRQEWQELRNSIEKLQ